MKRAIVLILVAVLLTFGVFSPKVSAVAEMPISCHLNGERVYTPADSIEVLFKSNVKMEEIASIRGGLFNSQDIILSCTWQPQNDQNFFKVVIPSTYIQRIWQRNGNREYCVLFSIVLKDGTNMSFKKTVFISDNTVQVFFVQCCPIENRANFDRGVYVLSSVSEIGEELRRPYDGGYIGTITLTSGLPIMFAGSATGCLSAVYTYYTTTTDGYKVKIRFSQWMNQEVPSKEFLDTRVRQTIERYTRGEPLYDSCNPDVTLYGSGQCSMWVWPPTNK